MHLPLPVASDRDRTAPEGRVANVAHRGASEDAPENTVAAIRHALDVGADMVEVDVQRSRDGVPVLIHDTTLGRTTDAQRVFPGRAPWRVGDFTHDELRRLDAGAWKSARFAGEGIPTLAEALAALQGSRAGLLLEVKAPELYPGIVSDLVATWRDRPDLVDPTAGRLVVQSFGFAAMKEHKTKAPRIPVGLLGAPARANLAVLATWADQVNPGHLSVDKAYVDHVHSLGMGCQVWTVNAAIAMRRALRLGVDGVITNRPHLFGRVLADHLAAGGPAAANR